MLLAIMLAEAAPAADPAGFDWKLLIFFGGVVILMFMMPRMVRRATAERRELMKQCDREVAGQTEIKNQVDKIMVEMVEAGQEINAQLDTKMRVLNRLIRDAEAVAERIEQQLARIEHLSASAVPTPPPSPVTPMTPANAPTRKATAFDPAKDTVLMDPTPGRPAITAANVSLNSNTESGRWRVDVRQKIEQHHREHRTPAEIARLLHLSLSEVNLVIDMYEARAKNG